MGYNGAGGYTRQRNFSADASAGIKILASAMDQELNDFASAMTVPILRDGQNTPTADLPMAGQKHTNVAAAASASDYLRAKEFIENVPLFVLDGDSNTTNVSASVEYYTTVSTGQAPPDGGRIMVRTSVTKSASADLVLVTPNGSYTTDILTPASTQTMKKQIKAGLTHEFTYNSARAAWDLMNPYRGLHGFSAHCYMVADDGSVTGANVSVSCMVNVDGDVTIINIPTFSVSASVSSSYLILSAIPVEARGAFKGTTQVIIRNKTNSTEHCVPCHVSTNGVMRFGETPAATGAANVPTSADVVIKVVGHTMTFFTDR